MRQVVSLIKDDQVHYAVVDDDAGEMIPFASIMLPDPDRFGLHEAALLGTNLIDAIGLNGKRPRSKAVAAKQEALPAGPTVVHEHDGDGDMRTPHKLPVQGVTRERVIEAIRAQPGMKASEIADAIGATTESARKAVQNRLKHMRDDPRLRWEKDWSLGQSNGVLRWYPGDTATPPPPEGLARSEASRRAMDYLDPQLTTKGTPRTRALPDPARRVKRFIPLSDVVAIINEYPEGITCRQIAERVWRNWGNDGDVERWVTRSVENRINNTGIERIQWSTSYRQDGNSRRKYLHPL